MGAIEAVRSNVFQRVVVVLRKVNKIAVPGSGNVTREGVRDFQIHRLSSAKWVLDVLPQRSLQSVVYRAADGKQHLVGADVRVDAGESRSRVTVGRARVAKAKRIAGVESIRGVVRNCRWPGGIAGSAVGRVESSDCWIAGTRSAVGGGD